MLVLSWWLSLEAGTFGILIHLMAALSNLISTSAVVCLWAEGEESTEIPPTDRLDVLLSCGEDEGTSTYLSDCFGVPITDLTSHNHIISTAFFTFGIALAESLANESGTELTPVDESPISDVLVSSDGAMGRFPESSNDALACLDACL